MIDRTAAMTKQRLLIHGEGGRTVSTRLLCGLTRSPCGVPLRGGRLRFVREHREVPWRRAPDAARAPPSAAQGVAESAGRPTPPRSAPRGANAPQRGHANTSNPNVRRIKLGPLIYAGPGRLRAGRVLSSLS
jgi:hypothetical protein